MAGKLVVKAAQAAGGKFANDCRFSFFSVGCWFSFLKYSFLVRFLDFLVVGGLPNTHHPILNRIKP